MDIQVTYDQDTSTLPAGFVAAVQYVVNLYDTTFSNNVTLKIHVGYGEVAGSSFSTALGKSTDPLWSVNYGDLRSALLAKNAPGVSSLPTASPFSARTLQVTNAELKALGITPPGQTSDGYDGSVGFASNKNWSYATTTAPGAGQYYFVGTVEHEFSEIMGRTSELYNSNAYEPIDLYRYQGSGNRQAGSGGPSYLSIDGGKTDLADFNNSSIDNGGDLADWAASAGADAFLDASSPGVINGLTNADITAMRALGWTTGGGQAGWQTVRALSNVFVGTYDTGTQEHPAVTALDNGNFIVAWDVYPPDNPVAKTVWDIAFDGDGNPAGGGLAHHGIVTGLETEPDLASFSTGQSLLQFVLAYPSSTSTPNVQLLDGNGVPIQGVTGAQAIARISGSSVAALGASLTFTGDSYLLSSIVSSNLTVSQPFTIATLHNDGFASFDAAAASGNTTAYVWVQGGGNAASAWFQLASGNTLIGSPTKIGDATDQVASGAIVGKIAATSLAGGGFAVAYVDRASTWGTPFSSITLRIYNSAGTEIGDPIWISSGTTADNVDPSITQLSNGAIAVGWRQDRYGKYFIRAVDLSGNTIAPVLEYDFVSSDGSLLPINTGEGQITALANNRLALVTTGPGDSGGTKIEAAVLQLNLPSSPDLVVQSIKPKVPSVAKGTNFSFSYTVENVGKAAAGATAVGIFLDNQTTPVVVATGALNPNASQTLTYSIGTANLSVGKHTLRIDADVNNLIGEGNESNNENSLTFTVMDPQTGPSPFTEFTDPDSDTEYRVEGLNDRGDMVGVKQYGPGLATAPFLYRGGSYTYLDRDSSYPNLGVDPIQVLPTGVNDHDQIVGSYYGTSADGHYTGYFGFLYSGGGSYTLLNDLPRAGQIFANAVNNLGEVVGSYDELSALTVLTPPGKPTPPPAYGLPYDGVQGFLYSGGVYTTLTAPGAATGLEGGTFVGGINDAGQIVGAYIDSGYVAHGFLYSNGQWTTLDAPGAGTQQVGGFSDATGTYATSINAAGQIVGYYYDRSMQKHGFLYSSGTWTKLDDPLVQLAPLNGTHPTAINDLGAIVGTEDYPASNRSFLYGKGLYPVSLSSPGSGAAVGAGHGLLIKLTFSDVAYVTGTPQLILNDGGIASYSGGSGTPTLSFLYTPAAPQNTTDLTVTGVSLPGGAAIKDVEGNAAALSSIKGADLGIAIDTTAPAVTSAAATANQSGTLPIGGTVGIELDLNERVTVTGAPALTLSNGGKATYLSSASNPTSGVLEFQYTVVTGQSSSDIKVAGPGLTGGTVKDAAGNAANLALTAAQADLHVAVDGTPPKVTSITTSAPNKDLLGLSSDTAAITLSLSEPVTVTGTPTLTLNDGGMANYVTSAGATSGTTTLTFTYQPGAESTTDLRVTGIAQSSGGIADLIGNPLASLLASDLKLAVNIFTFNQIGGGNWDVASNWTPNATPSGPTAGDTALITKAGTYTVSSTESNAVAVLNTAAKATLAIGSGATFKITSGTGAGANAGTIVVADGGTLALGGTFVNGGSVRLNAAGGGAALRIAGALTLSGGGKVLLSSAGGNAISANGSAASLLNVNDTIAGAGVVGDADLSFVNKGTVNGNTAAALTLDTGAHVTVNSGTLEATAGGWLDVASDIQNFKTIGALGASARVSIEGTIVNAGSGSVIASGGSAHVDLTGAALSGGTLKAAAGAMIDVVSGGSALVSGGTIAAATLVKTLDSATLTLSGTVFDSGTVFASGAGSLVDITGVVSGGGIVEVGNGMVEIGSAGRENIAFQSGGTGQLKLDAAAAFSGRISGFGAGQNKTQSIDLADINFSALHSLAYQPANGANLSGTLTVTDGSHTASLVFIGHYTLANFSSAPDSGGGVTITDPAADPAQSTAMLLAPGGGAAVALLGHHLAASFTGGGHGGAGGAEALQILHHEPPLTLPHAG